LKAFGQNQPTTIPVQTAPSEDKLRIVIKVLKIAISEFNALPAHSLPAIK
jgi:hypothetical protein